MRQSPERASDASVIWIPRHRIDELSFIFYNCQSVAALFKHKCESSKLQT